MEGEQVQPAIDDGGLAGLQVARQRRAMAVAQSVGDDHRRELAPERLGVRVSEGALGGRVPVPDTPVDRHDDHRVDGRLEHPAGREAGALLTLALRVARHQLTSTGSYPACRRRSRMWSA